MGRGGVRLIQQGNIRVLVLFAGINGIRLAVVILEYGHIPGHTLVAVVVALNVVHLLGVHQLEGAEGRIRYGKTHLRPAVPADPGVIHRVAHQGVELLQYPCIRGPVGVVHDHILPGLFVIQHLGAFHNGVVGIRTVKRKLQACIIINGRRIIEACICASAVVGMGAPVHISLQEVTGTINIRLG
ncbi:hypothetical protein D3C81_1580200 [compost metagenome]